MTRITLRKLKKYCGFCNYYRSAFNSERFLLTYKIDHNTLADTAEDDILILNEFDVKYKPKTLRRYSKRCTDNSTGSSKSTHSCIPLSNIPREKYNLHTLTRSTIF